MYPNVPECTMVSTSNVPRHRNIFIYSMLMNILFSSNLFMRLHLFSIFFQNNTANTLRKSKST